MHREHGFDNRSSSDKTKICASGSLENFKLVIVLVWWASWYDQQQIDPF